MSRRIVKICAMIWGVSGLVILISVIYPIASYEAKARQRYPQLISPLAEEESITLEDYDYTRASNWFPGAKEKEEFLANNVRFYTITIPSLNISDATVSIGGEDLSDNLIQYPGTALPGKNGNSVIFGHSILPLFFDPENYLSIFSTLDKLDEGDEVYINYDGISYIYKVKDMFEVKPTDIQILDQDSNGSFLTLVTCTPMGDPRKPKRLIVRAQLFPSQDPLNFTKQSNADTLN